MKFHLPPSDKIVRELRCGIGAAMAACIVALFLGGPSAVRADLTINPTFTTAFANDFGSAGETAWENAAAVYTSTFSASSAVQHAIINITVDSNPNVFGASQTNPFSFSSYTALQTAFTANANLSGNLDQLASVNAGGSLSTPNPDPSGSYSIATAQAKALGLIANTGMDGTTLFGANNPWYFGTGTPPAGQYYFEGVALHEIAEVMGRIGNETTGSYTSLDLFAYTGAGVRSLVNGDNAFFSIDNGTTLLKEYNPNTTNGLDSRDWMGAPGPPDAYNQFSDSGVINGFTTVDQREMNVLGYDLPQAAAVPEPSTLAIAGLTAILGLGSCILRKRRPAA
jgi:hypothetical protein